MEIISVTSYIVKVAYTTTKVMPNIRNSFKLIPKDAHAFVYVRTEPVKIWHEGGVKSEKKFFICFPNRALPK